MPVFDVAAPPLTRPTSGSASESSFTLDCSQETANEDDDDMRTARSASQEDLLVHSYPPPAAPDSSLSSSDEKQQPESERYYSIAIPTREAVSSARRRPAKRERHPKLILAGLASLLAFAYFATQFLAMFTRFNGKPKVQVILMISDGMGEIRHASAFGKKKLILGSLSLAGPASETFARTYLRYLHDTNSSSRLTTPAATRSLLNESVWAGLEKEFEPKRGGAGTPLDSILVGSSRVRPISQYRD